MYTETKNIIRNLDKDEPKCIISHLERETLEKLHTKQLLNRLRGHYLSTSCYEYCKNASICSKINRENIELIKDILKDRPHILNKKESKELRKARIKKGK